MRSRSCSPLPIGSVVEHQMFRLIVWGRQVDIPVFCNLKFVKLVGGGLRKQNESSLLPLWRQENLLSGTVGNHGKPGPRLGGKYVQLVSRVTHLSLMAVPHSGKKLLSGYIFKTLELSVV